MAQYARPTSDISQGSWTDEGTVDNDGNLYTSIDEETHDGDDSYIVSSTGPDVCEVGLGSVTDPQVSTGHIVHIWFRSIGGGGPEKLTIDLRQGTTTIATMANQTNRSGTYIDVNYTLTAGEADSITDYSALRIRLTNVNAADGEEIRVTMACFEVPDAGVLVELQGTSDGAATVTGNVIRTLVLAGTSDGVAGVSSDLLRVLRTLLGSSDGLCNVPDVLLKKTIPIQGTSDGVATVISNLVRMFELLGTSDGVATADGSLTIVGVVYLAGTSDGVATVDAILKGTWALKGTSDGEAAVSGNLIRVLTLAGTADGAATVSGQLLKDIYFIATSDGIAAVDGNLIRELALKGTADGVASTLAQLIRDVYFGAIADGAAVVVGDLTVTAEMIWVVEAIELRSPITKEVVMDSRLADEVELASPITKVVNLRSKIPSA